MLALAIAGLGLSLPWGGRATRRLLGRGRGRGRFAVFAAPVLLSGQATFAGYIKLDDTASWLGLTDRLLEHGRNLTGIEPSSCEATLNYYWNDYGYPVGAFPPLGVGHDLIGIDVAWLFQPYLCFLAAMLALGLYELLSRLIESPRHPGARARSSPPSRRCSTATRSGGASRSSAVAGFLPDRRSRHGAAGRRARAQPRPTRGRDRRVRSGC